MAASEDDLHKPEARRRAVEAHKIYGRGRKVFTKGIKDKKLRANLKHLEGRYEEAALKSKDAEILLENESGYLEVEGELERTYKIRQNDLRKDIAVDTAKKGFELKLHGLGPYVADYTPRRQERPCCKDGLEGWRARLRATGTGNYPRREVSSQWSVFRSSAEETCIVSDAAVDQGRLTEQSNSVSTTLMV